MLILWQELHQERKLKSYLKKEIMKCLRSKIPAEHILAQILKDKQKIDEKYVKMKLEIWGFKQYQK